MAKSNELLGYLKANHITQYRVAKIIGRSLSTTNRKINRYSDFTQSEIRQLHNELKIPLRLFI